MKAWKEPPVRETESGFQDALVELAHLHRWRVAHFRPARTLHGWRVAGQYDAKGWPDLVLVRPPRVVAIEVKAEGGTVTPEQARWLEDLKACGIETHVVMPSDFGAIVMVLR